jgi:hypothetical protein
MDTALVVITVLSVGLTCALLVYAARLQREQRERAAARVAALARAIREEPAPSAHDFAVAATTSAPRTADANVAAANADALAAFAEASWLDPHATPRDDAPDAQSPERTASSPVAATLFEDHAQAAQRTPLTLLLVFGGLAIIGCLFGGAYAWSQPGSTAFAATGAPVTTPIELLALEQVRKETALVVSGTVRNPDRAPARKGLSAMVFLFDGSGQVVASGRAPLDVQLLTAGDESPFVVSVPDAARAVRMRVSFRSGSAVVGHVDRRSKQ